MPEKILLRNKGGIWTIETVSGTILSSRRWPDEFKALQWCKAFMSSFNSAYTIEVINDK